MLLWTANPNPVRLTGNSLLVNSHKEKRFSLQETSFLITGSLFSLQGFPCKPLYFPVKDYCEYSFKVCQKVLLMEISIIKLTNEYIKEYDRSYKRLHKRKYKILTIWFFHQQYDIDSSYSKIICKCF